MVRRRLFPDAVDGLEDLLDDPRARDPARARRGAGDRAAPSGRGPGPPSAARRPSNDPASCWRRSRSTGKSASAASSPDAPLPARAAPVTRPAPGSPATAERREDPAPLGHMRDAQRGPLMRRQRRQVPPPEARCVRRAAADRAPRSSRSRVGLARAVRPDDGDELPLGRPRGTRSSSACRPP